jgi:hypothetical protein
MFFHHEADQAIAVTNRATKSLTFYRPRTTLIPWIPLNDYHSSTSSTANNSPRNSIAQLNASDSEVSNEVLNNALNTDIMLTGMFGSAPGDEYFFGNGRVAPAEMFAPFAYPNMNFDPVDDEDEDYESNFEEDNIDIAEYMNLSDDTDVEQDDEAQDPDVPATPATSTMALNGSTPAPPMTDTPASRKRTTSDVMLEHFDRGVVTAFRSNQNRYRDVASQPTDPAARASVSRPVRSGKSAEALITPLRKRSRSNRLNRVAKSPLKRAATLNQSSPLSGVSKAASRLQDSVNEPPRPPPRMGEFS